VRQVLVTSHAGLDPLMVQRSAISFDTLSAAATRPCCCRHVLTEVEATCDRIGVIRAGRMVATGTVADLKRNAARRVTVDFREAVKAIPAVSGVTLLNGSARQWVLR
jgi:ABC-2 type transport system ATP-binding protein